MLNILWPIFPMVALSLGQADQKTKDPVGAFAFTQLQYNISIDENVRGKLYATPDVSQKKMGVYLPATNGQVKFRIVRGDKNDFFKATSTRIGNFVFLRIQTQGGLNMALNRELKHEYQLLVKATFKRKHSGNLETRTEIRIKIKDRNDLAPIFFPSEYTADIMEDVPLLTEVLRVAASDPDEHLNGEVFYSLQKTSDYFSVHPATGAILTIKPLTSTQERKQELIVQAVDRASLVFPKPPGFFRRPPNTATVLINILSSNLHAPTIRLSGPQLSVKKESTQTQTIAKISIFDEDEGRAGNIKSVQLRDVSEDCDGYFVLDSEKDQDLYYLRTVGGFQFPADVTKCRISIEALDNGRPQKSNVNELFVNVRSKERPNLAFKQYSLEFSINESTPIGSLIGYAELDGASPDNCTFELLSDIPELPFSIDPANGVLNLSSPLDYETQKEYSCKIRVSSPTQSAALPVTLTILDANDNDPRFITEDPNSREVFIDDDTELETVITRVQATDEDSGLNGKVTYKITNRKDTPFLIDSISGAIKLRSQLKDNSATAWNLRVRATDWGQPLRREAETDVIVCIRGKNCEPPQKQASDINQNENEPFFGKKIYKGMVNEDAPAGTTILSVRADDIDYGYNGLVQYVLGDEGNLDRHFTIDPTSGELKIFKPLHASMQREFRLKVIATDLGAQPKTTEALIQITVSDVNNHGPVFARPLYSTEIQEDTAVGTKILQVEADDEDLADNGKIRYSLLTKTEDFTLNSEGFLSILNPLDRERIPEYELKVQATDNGRPPLSSTTKVAITLTDVNDNPPRCPNKLQKVRITEDWPVNALVTCVEAEDPDIGRNGRVRYSLEKSLKNGKPEVNLPFKMIPTTGCVLLIGELNFEKRPLYNLTVEVSDAGRPQYSSLCNILIELIDVDENSSPPRLKDKKDFALKFSVHENEEIGTEVGKIDAEDPDEPHAPLEYSFGYEDGSDTGGLFSIDRNGVIRTAVRLDREKKSEYWLRVIVSDTAPIPKRLPVDVYIEVLDKNDHFPFPSKPMYFAEVQENSPSGTLVTKIDATDEDSISEDGLEYRISRGDPQSFFKVDPSTGYITTYQRKLDREAQAEQELEIAISDRGETRHTSLVKVVIKVKDMNDNAPKFLRPIYNFNVPSTVEKDELLCRVFASDEDEGENADLFYSIAEESTVPVRIRMETGEIFAKRPLEAETKIELTVGVKDGTTKSAKSAQTRVIINVLNTVLGDPEENQPPVIKNQDPLMITIAETENVGQIDFVEAEDPDGDKLWFEFTSGNIGEIFSLRKDTGELQLTEKLSESQENLYFLTYTVSDSLSSVEGTIEVSIRREQNFRPKFNQTEYKIELPESTEPGTRILSLTTNDHMLDSDDNNEVAPITYFIHGSQEEESKSLFKVDPEKGDLVLVEHLDHESNELHGLVIGARRKHLTNFTHVFIKVTDSNDHAPSFISNEFEARVLENAPVGSEFLHLKALDQDSGTNGEVTYAIVSGNDNGFWELDEVSGQLRVASNLSLDFPEALLVVKATDRGEPPLTDIATIRIVVDVSGDSLPRFTQETYLITVPENLKPGAYIMTVHAECLSSVLYEFAEPHPVGVDIQAVSGIIHLTEPLDFERDPFINFTVLATTKLGASGRAGVRLAVEDINDHHPSFTESTYEGSVQENMPSGSVVMSVTGKNVPLVLSATDKDLGVNAMLTYEIVDQWATKFFAVDYGTGALRTRKPLDFETKKSYKFRVQASDMGSPSLTTFVPATVYVDVLDMNDVAPHFTSRSYAVTLYLPTCPGAEVITLAAADADTVGDLAYTVTGSTTAWETSIFEVGKHDGKITVASTEGLEEGLIEMEITASDGVLSDAATVRISVTSLDNVPQSTRGFRFLEPSYSVTVLENSTRSSIDSLLVLGTIGTELSEHVKFSLLNSNPWFELNEDTGELITTGVAIDREVTSQVFMVAEARDFRKPPRVARTKITASVQDINDNPPRFVNKPYFAIITSDSAVGSNVTKVEALDVDDGRNGQVRYQIRGETKIFTIHPISGVVSLKHPFQTDFRMREFSFTVLAKDQGTPALSASAELKIKVVHKAMPVFEKPFYTIDVKEDSPPGNQLLVIKAHSNESGTIAYAVVDGDPEGAFDIHYSEGILTLERDLDRERTGGYNLTVRALDISRSDIYSDVSVAVRVTDINDNSPSFWNNTYLGQFSEATSIGAELLVLSATDIDDGKNSEIFYSLRGPDSESFEIAEETGILYLRSMLNYEDQKVFEFTAVAEDSGVPRRSSTCNVRIEVIDVNDEPPSFTDPVYQAFLPEDAPPGHFITAVLARDPDSVVSGGLTGLMYSVLDGDETPALFSLDSRSGVVRTKRRLPEDIALHYQLNISATDGAFSSYATLNINITQSPDRFEHPFFTKEYFVASVMENGVAGSEVMALEAMRGLAPLTYSFAGEGSSRPFRIDSESGQVILLKPLDYEQQIEYRYSIAVQDRLGRRGYSNLVVNVLDQNDNSAKFVANEYKAILSSNTTRGQKVFQFRAEDEDTGDSVEYSMYKDTSFEQPDVWTYFKLHRRKGKLSVKRSLLKLVGKEFKFFVRATDRGNPPSQTEVPASIVVGGPKDRRLRFKRDEFKFSISEDAEIGTFVPKETSNRAALRKILPRTKFTILENQEDPASLPFSVNRETGMLRLIRKLDREMKSEYSFVLQAETKENGKASEIALTTIRIAVDDINDNKPEFDGRYESIEISEDSPVGTSITIISASDKDVGPSGEVLFSLQGQDAFGVFEIDLDLGWIRLISPLDREIKSSYEFVVVASDRGTVPKALHSETPVKIIVTDVNDQEPRFLDKDAEFNVQENVRIGTVVGTLLVKDDDLFPNNQSRLSIIEGDPTGYFEIKDSGQIHVMKNLDYEQQKLYSLMVLAWEGSHSTTSSVVINVEDVNDHAPTCEIQHITLRLPEDTSVGTEIFTVIADDMDSGVNAELLYYLNGKFSTDFEIDASGRLQVAKPLNREEVESYELEVQVEDRGGMACNVKMTLVILDINDNPPKFEKDAFTARVIENQDPGAHFVTRVRATDADLGLAGRVQYALLNTDLDEIFWVDEISGAVTVQRPLDREDVPAYNLSILATDQGVDNQLSATVLLTVAVDDVNDHPPEFTQKEWEVDVSEQEQAGLELVKLEAFSADLNDTVRYHIVAPVSALDFFSIDKKSGSLSLKHPLDYETQQRHVLTIEAVDAGDPPLSARAVVKVQVVDSNDNHPQFTKRLFKEKIPEDAATGSRIAKLSAADLDSGDNAVITYRLARENKDLNVFNVSEDGWITVTSALDYETESRHRFLVEAWDSGKRPLSDTTVVEIHITDVNDNPPVFTDCNLSADIQEGLQSGISLLTVDVSDADGEGNGAPFAFSVTGPGSEKFRISTDGVLRTETTLAYNDAPTYLLMISATDSGVPALTSECPLTVRVLEESKFPPNLEPIAVLVKSYLGEFPGGQLAIAQARDKDEQDTLVYGLAESGDFTKLAPFLDIDPNSGVIKAGKGLPLGNYQLNVSVSDGKFKTYAPLILEMELIGEDELGFAMSVRIREITAVSFVENYEKKFRKVIAKLLSARPRSVKLLSVQEVPQRARAYRAKRDTTPRPLPDLDVLFAIKKGRNAFFRPEFIRQSLEGKNEELSDRLNLKVAGLVTEVCRRDSCVHGQCRDRLWMDDTGVLSISGRKASFVAPMHEREFQCICSEGYGGKRCDIAINACSRNNTCESRWSLCIPRETPVGYSCACLPGTKGPKCTQEACERGQCTNENLMSLVGKSYARYTLSSPLTRRLQLALHFRTAAPKGILMHGSGAADYHILEVKQGRVQYRFNCGSGEGKIAIRGLVVSDGNWHEISVVRRGRYATLSVDRETAEGFAPGTNAVLNLNSNDLTFGAEVRPHSTLMGREELFHGFTGCIRRIRVDGFDLPLSKTGTKLYNVEFDCPESFIAGVCSSAPCQNGGHCEVESMDEYRCVCPTRFTGRNCDTDLNPCQSEPCPESATCQNLFNDYFCLCPPGLTHKKCLIEGMNPCDSAPCENNGHCLRLGRGFQCNCTSNWSGRHCSKWIPSNIEGNDLGITIPEIIGIVVVLLVLIALTCLIVMCCRRQGRNGYKKARYLQTQANNEIMLDHAHAHIRNQIVSSELSQRTPEIPPPLPPRHRGFHRNSKLSNLESAQLTGLPTVQVRPLSFSDNREETPAGSLERERWEDEMATCAFGRRRGQVAGGNLENARNYGSAAEELEKLSRYSNELFQNIKKSGRPDTDRNLGRYDEEDTNHNKESIDWRDHLDLLSVDSIERIKSEARNTEGGQGRTRSESDPMVTARSMASIQCLPEDENHEFQWDYTDWNSTMNRPIGPHSRHSGDFTEDDEGASLPEGVSGVEDMEMMDEMTPLEIPEMPPTPDFKRQLLALQEMASKDSGKPAGGKLEPSGGKSGKKSVPDVPPEDEYVTMKPLSSYQRHLDKYLPKHRPPPDSSQSQRKPLLSSSAERELGVNPSSESEDDPGSNAATVVKYGFPRHSGKVTDSLHLHTYDIPPLSSKRSRGGSLDVGRPDSLQSSVEGKLTQALSVQSGLSGVCDIDDSEYPTTDDDEVRSADASSNNAAAAAQRQTEV